MEQGALSRFECACCDGEFETEQTDEDLLADFKARYPGELESAGVFFICDDCHQRFQEWRKKQIH